VVAEGICHDGRISRTCWRIAEVRPATVGTPRRLTSAASASACIGCPARRPGNSQRESRFVAVSMLSRFSTQSSRRSATAPGTGDGGSPSRSRTCSPAWITSSMVRPDDTAERLRVEQDDGGRDAAPERQAVAGQEAAEQVHAFGLRERCRLADHRPGQSETPGELVGHAPLQERPEGVAAMLVVLDVPGVDVVLAAGGQIEAVLGEPSKEGRGVLDLVAGMAATSWGDRLLLRADAKARQDFPGSEARTSWAWLGSVMSARWPTRASPSTAPSTSCRPMPVRWRSAAPPVRCSTWCT